jgi:DNA-binding NarL/FixJ family response regulator
MPEVGMGEPWGPVDAQAVRILHCDDSAGYRALMRVLLERHPVLEVSGEAGDGGEGGRLAAIAHPDVVVLDLDMPGCDGLQALALLRAAGSRATVYVLSGSTDDAARDAAVAAGAAGWFRKGADEHALVERLLEAA